MTIPTAPGDDLRERIAQLDDATSKAVEPAVRAHLMEASAILRRQLARIEARAA